MGHLIVVVRHQLRTNLYQNLSQVMAHSHKIGSTESYARVEGEFWSSGQREASSIHEVSYRACFKPQLPRFFIESLTEPGDVVYDPFAGRGTTAIESALLGRNVIANDVNPISTLFTKSRLARISTADVTARLEEIPKLPKVLDEYNLEMFYEAQTMAEILALREYLAERKQSQTYDFLDRWIEMVAMSRLTGHSPGFFSVYSLPPNQALSRERQIKINETRSQRPTYRDTHHLITKKTKQLISGLSPLDAKRLEEAGEKAIFLNEDAAATSLLDAGSVQLTVTSPPFLDVVQYAQDNWLRAWFLGVDADEVAKKITMSKTLDQWNEKMTAVFSELYRVTADGGHVAFEVGEVRKGKIKLEEAVIPVGLQSGFSHQVTLINSQTFTKTSNIWGVANNASGTNSNRIVLFQK